MLPVKMVVNSPLKSIEVPANTENALHVPSMPDADEVLDGLPDAEAEAEAAIVNEEEPEGETSTTGCVSDGVSDA